MFIGNKEGISVQSVLDKRQAKKSGLYAVRIRVTYKRISKYYNTNIDMSPEDWLSLSKARAKHAIANRNYVKERFDLIFGIVDELAMARRFSFESLKREFTKHTSPSYFAEH